MQEMVKAGLRELAPSPAARSPYHASYLAFTSSGMPWIGRSPREMGVILLLTWMISRRVLWMSESEGARFCKRKTSGAKSNYS